MPAIGYGIAGKNGRYDGYRRTLLINAPITLMPVVKIQDQAPDSRVPSDGAEVGRAWIRLDATTARQHIALILIAPELPRRIHAYFGLISSMIKQTALRSYGIGPEQSADSQAPTGSRYPA